MSPTSVNTFRATLSHASSTISDNRPYIFMYFIYDKGGPKAFDYSKLSPSKITSIQDVFNLRLW